jgi:GAG-pre-integrase domain
MVLRQRSAIRNANRLFMVSSKHVDQPDNVQRAAERIINTAIAYQATNRVEKGVPQFDSDSYIIAIDNCCSRCITNSLSDYVGPTTKTRTRVKGVGGDLDVSIKGTVHSTIEADNGTTHTHVIPDVYYNKHTPYRLLSPQHLAQVSNDNYPSPNGTWCATYRDHVILQWSQRQYTRTVPLDKATNIALIRTTPRYNRFSAFCAAVEPAIGSTLESTQGMIIEHHETHSADATDIVHDLRDDSELAVRRHPDLPDSVFPDLAANDGAPPWELPDQPDHQGLSASDEMLAWHYRLGHVSFKKIRKMAERGDLPAKLAKCVEPKCAACMYGQATRTPWRTKPKANTPLMLATFPGQLVSIDQLISPTPGLVAQMKGFLTNTRYTAVTVFVDHFSNASFAYYQKSTTADESILAKEAFERWAAKHGVSVRAYLADNGIFETAAFTEAVHRSGQTIEYCAVGGHHQNGKAEKKIRDLQEMGRAMLLHAVHRWPAAVTAN